MRLMLFAGAWLTTIAVAFLVGRSTSQEVAIDAPSTPPRSTGGDPTGTVRVNSRAPSAGISGHAGADSSGNPEASPVSIAGVAERPVDMSAPTFDFLQGGTIQELSQRFRDYVAAHLDRGPGGYISIVRSIDRLIQTDHAVLRNMNERMAVQEAYPWISMLVRKEPMVLDFLEFVYRSMAENPSLFKDLDDDTLEIFVDGTPQILTGAMDEPRLDRMIEYARAILAATSEEQPASIQGIRRDLERLLSRAWAEPVTQVEALEMIRSGDLAPEQALAMLRSLDAQGGMPAPDLNTLISLALSTGDTRAIRDMQRFPSELIDPVTLDVPVILGMEAGKYQGYYVRNYLVATGRDKWPDSRRFMDHAFSSGGMASEAAATTLQYMRGDPKPPDKAYVEDVLQRYELSEGTVGRLRATYGLQ